MSNMNGSHVGAGHRIEVDEGPEQQVLIKSKGDVHVHQQAIQDDSRNKTTLESNQQHLKPLPSQLPIRPTQNSSQESNDEKGQVTVNELNTNGNLEKLKQVDGSKLNLPEKPDSEASKLTSLCEIIKSQNTVITQFF